MKTSHIFERVNQLELFRSSRDGIDVAFAEFHDKNPHVYRHLVTLTQHAKRRGLRRVGMKMLFEVVRWRTALQTSDPTGLKLNNNYTSRYARLLTEQERCSPECEGCARPDCLVGMFEMRQLDSERAA